MMYYSTNAQHKRMKALRELEEDKYKQEVLGTSLSRYIIEGNSSF
jgi:hypothetical protein